MNKNAEFQRKGDLSSSQPLPIYRLNKETLAVRHQETVGEMKPPAVEDVMYMQVMNGSEVKSGLDRGLHLRVPILL